MDYYKGGGYLLTLEIDKDTGDLVFDGQNNLTYVSNKGEQTQSVRLLLSTNTGEWFLNTLFGLAYQYIQVKNPDENKIRAEILKALQQEPRIARVNDLTVSFNNPSRTLTINFTATMTDGNTIEVNEVV